MSTPIPYPLESLKKAPPQPGATPSTPKATPNSTSIPASVFQGPPKVDAPASAGAAPPKQAEATIPPPPPSPQAYPGLPKNYQEAYEREGKLDWEERQQRLATGRSGAERESISLEEARDTQKRRKEADAAYQAYRDNPTEENWKEVERAVSVASGKFMPRGPQYRPSKYEIDLHGMAGVPVGIPYSEMNDEQRRNYDMAAAVGARQNQQKIKDSIRHMDVLIANAGSGSGTKADKEYRSYRYRALKTRLASIQSDLYAIQNSKTTGVDDVVGKIAELNDQREKVEKEIDEIQNLAVSGTVPSSAGHVLGNKYLGKYGVAPAPEKK
jgi:hypothetical protein